MTPRSPIEFVRQILGGGTQRCGNRVQPEDENGNPWNAGNPVPVTGPLTAAQLAALIVAVADTWTPDTEIDVTDNDSDKPFVVPAGEQWEIESIFIQYASTATVGNRQVTVEIQSPAAAVLLQLRAGVVQAASLTRYYDFALCAPNEMVFGGPGADRLMTNLPPLRLSAGYTVRVYDAAAIAAAADDMHVWIMFIRKAA